MREIKISDETLRDGPQSLWATRITTGEILPISAAMDRIGFQNITLMSITTFDVCVRYLKENPWERIRLVQERMPRTHLGLGIRRGRSISAAGFALSPDDMIELSFKVLAMYGAQPSVGGWDSMLDVDNLVHVSEIAKRVGAPPTGGGATLNFSESPVHTDQLYVQKAKEMIERLGVNSINIADEAGVLSPERTRTLIPALQEAVGPHVSISLHCHCNSGLAAQAYMEAVKLGVNSLSCAIAPLANASSIPSVQNTVRNLRHAGYEVNIDDKLVKEVEEHFNKVVKYTGKPAGVPAEYDLPHFHHQVPGGMTTNLQFMLDQAGMSDRLEDVLQETAAVRKDLGWVIMVSPFSMMVGAQAAINVVQGERYRVVLNEIKQLALGYYGKHNGPIDQNALDRIVANGSEDIPLTPEPLPPALPSLRREYPHASDEELLLRHMFAGPQVDDMLAAGPMKTGPSLSQAALPDLIREVSRRPNIGRFYIRKPDFTIDLVKGSPSSSDDSAAPQAVSASNSESS